jgi:hypothetical protein
MTTGSVSARRKIERIIDRLGGMHSLAASCAWHVIGLDMPIADWKRVRRWSAGEPLSQIDASRVLWSGSSGRLPTPERGRPGCNLQCAGRRLKHHSGKS